MKRGWDELSRAELNAGILTCQLAVRVMSNHSTVDLPYRPFSDSCTVSRPAHTHLLDQALIPAGHMVQCHCLPAPAHGTNFTGVNVQNCVMLQMLCFNICWWCSQ